MSFVVALSGGIGSGKSVAAETFADLGATIVDTDAIAHDLTRTGGAALPAIRRLFGDAYIDASGAMDRARVRKLVFGDAAARKALEALLHPMIRAEAQRRVAAAAGPYVVLVVPLLVESSDYRSRADRVLVVDCPEPTQVARVRARSGLTEDEVRGIIRAQAPREARLAVADDVIDNGGDVEALRRQVQALHRRYLEQAAQASG